eukprot:m.20243 g.20243  ORF g.20243 m.20243 type:complete len:187 (+) comp27992_c0_seq1:89-649(+)
MGEAKIGITLDVFLEGKSALLKCYCYQGKTTFESLLNANEREIQELGHLEKLRNGGTTEIARIQRKECGRLFLKDQAIPSTGTYRMHLRILSTVKAKQEAIETKTWTRLTEGQSKRPKISIEDGDLHLSNTMFTDKRERTVQTETRHQDISIKSGSIVAKDGAIVVLGGITRVTTGCRNVEFSEKD